MSRASDTDADLAPILAAFERTRSYFLRVSAGSAVPAAVLLERPEDVGQVRHYIAQSTLRGVSGAGSAHVRMRYAH